MDSNRITATKDDLVRDNEFDLFDDPYHPHGSTLSMYEALVLAAVRSHNPIVHSTPTAVADYAVAVADEVVAKLKKKRKERQEALHQALRDTHSIGDDYEPIK